MDEFAYELKIPKERVAVLIGVKGSVKSFIEKSTNTKMVVDSEEGNVVLKGDDPLLLFSAREVVRAIGRGFSPDVANLLLKQDYLLEVIAIDADKPAQLERLRGRVIGEKGKSRTVIEDLSETNISVYGKTVSIIGMYDCVAVARRAIEGLLSGNSHAHVYYWLEKQRRVRKQREVVENW